MDLIFQFLQGDLGLCLKKPHFVLKTDYIYSKEVLFKKYFLYQSINLWFFLKSLKHITLFLLIRWIRAFLKEVYIWLCVQVCSVLLRKQRKSFS